MKPFAVPEPLRGSAYTKRVDRGRLGCCIGDFVYRGALGNSFMASADLTAMHTPIMGFVDWRKDVVRSKRVLGLCRFVLRRLLHPNPPRRAGVAELVRFCDWRLEVPTRALQDLLLCAMYRLADWLGSSQRVAPLASSGPQSAA